MATVTGSEDSNTVISGDMSGILHPRSVITADDVKIFHDLDEYYCDYRKKLESWRPNLSEFLQPQPPATHDKCETLSKTKQAIYPEHKSLACELNLSKDFMKKYMEFSFVVPALNFYNQKNGTNFKLVDTTHSRMFYFRGAWAHCVFQVALPDSPYTKNFFAEVLRHNESYKLKYEVKTVGALFDTKCFKCSLCDGLNIPHPRDFISSCR